MEDQKMQESSRHQWKSLFHLIRRAGIPWYLFVFTFLMDALSATLFVKLPVLLGEIMKGEIMNGGQISKYGLMSAAQVVFSFFSMMVFNLVYARVNASSSNAAWNRILHLPMRVLFREKPSTLTSRVTNDSDGVSMALSGIFNCLSMIYTLVMVYIEMFRMNSTISLMLLLIPAWLFISMRIVGNMSYRAQTKVQNSLSAFTSYLSVRLPNMRQMKAFGTEQQEQKNGEEKIEEQYSAEMTIVKINALSSMMQNLSTTLCNIIVLAFGGYLVSTGKLEAGDLITFFIFVAQGTFTYNGENLLMYYQNIKFGLGACTKIMDMMDTDEEVMKRDKSFTVPEADLHFDHVNFAYEEKPVLKDVSFTIPKGCTTAIVGTNGSGKTTILKLLERFYEPDSGSITYGNENIEKYHLDEWRDSIGYVVQNSPLLQGSILDNITYGMQDPDRAAAEQAAREADAEEFIRQMPQGYESEVGELGGKLSGGQRQKIAIARAMIHHPELILLDEATCGLDACSEQEILQTLSTTLSGKTVVMIAHSAAEVQHADQIIVMHNGEVAGCGTHKELLEQNERYQEFCRHSA